jgi:hypothetical protein
MTVDCIPQWWELKKGDTTMLSMGIAPEGLGDTIVIRASNYGFDVPSATKEDDT